MEARKATKPYPGELRERAVRLVREHEAEHGSPWAAIRSIAEKVGCSAETLRLGGWRASRSAETDSVVHASSRRSMRAGRPRAPD